MSSSSIPTSNPGAFAVSRALAIPELLHLALSHHHTTRTLAAAARTCKAWSKPALDILWKDLHSLAPLLGLLGILQYASGAWAFRGQLDTGGFSRLAFYAQRVRSLAVDDTEAWMTPDALAEAMTYLGMASLATNNAKTCWRLLPNLKVVSWSSSRAENLRHCLVLMNPTLDKVVIALGHSERQPSTPRVLRAIGCLASSGLLKPANLSVPTSIFDADVNAEFAKVVGSMPQLTNLFTPRIRQAGDPILATLGQLPKLRSLCTFFQTSTWVQLRALLDRLVEACPLLVSLRLELQVPEGPTLTFQQVTPILELKALLSLEIAPKRQIIQLGREDIHAMAQAWPKLRVLSLTSRPPQQRLHEGTLVSNLVHFSAGFPDLRRLELPVAVDDPIPPHSAFKSFRKLERLDVGCIAVTSDMCKALGEYLGWLSPMGVPNVVRVHTPKPVPAGMTRIERDIETLRVIVETVVRTKNASMSMAMAGHSLV